jgi:uncharacterized membrane protein YhaH (DUF805 family)
MNWYLDVMRNYAVFRGRSPRKAYWMFVLINLVVAILVGFVGKVLGMGTAPSALYSLIVLIPGIAVAVRRLHDTGRSGWWLLFPFVNLIFLCLDSQPGENQFGPNQRMA